MVDVILLVFFCPIVVGVVANDTVAQGALGDAPGLVIEDLVNIGVGAGDVDKLFFIVIGVGDNFATRIHHRQGHIGIVVAGFGLVRTDPADVLDLFGDTTPFVVAPSGIAAGVIHAGAVPDAVGALVVAVADIVTGGGVITRCGSALEDLSNQAVQIVIIQLGSLIFGVNLGDQVAKGIVLIAPIAHVWVAHGSFLPGFVVNNAGFNRFTVHRTTRGFEELTQLIVFVGDIWACGRLDFDGVTPNICC